MNEVAMHNFYDDNYWFGASIILTVKIVERSWLPLCNSLPSSMIVCFASTLVHGKPEEGSCKTEKIEKFGRLL